MFTNTKRLQEEIARERDDRRSDTRQMADFCTRLQERVKMLEDYLEVELVTEKTHYKNTKLSS